MKKVLFYSLILLVFSSCAVKLPYYEATAVLDYSKYTNKGFYISEISTVPFEYKAIADISAIIRTGNTPLMKDGKPVAINPGDNDVYLKLSNNKIVATREAALDLLYKKAVESGANGIIRLSIVNAPNVTGYGFGYLATGLAIKK